MLSQSMADVRRAMDPKFVQVCIYEHCLLFDASRAYNEAVLGRQPAHLEPSSVTARCGIPCRRPIEAV